MQVQYVVDFEIRVARNTGANAYCALISHVDEWFARTYIDAPSADALLSSKGEVLLRPRPELLVPSERRTWTMGPEQRELRWSKAGTSEVFASRFDLRSPVSGDSAAHVTSVTVTTNTRHDFTGFRVAMGREMMGGWLAPVPLSFVRRPGIVRRVVTDNSLRVTTLNQVVDGRYNNVRNAAEVTAVIDSLKNSRRLPMLLVAPASQAAWDFARSAANELPGLASVVCLGSHEARLTLEEALPDLPVPSGTARLVWPDLSAFRHPDLTRAQIASDEPDYLVSKLFRMLAPLSVVARGTDISWREAERAERARARDEAARRLRDAEERGDQAESIATLKNQVAAAEKETEGWAEEATRLDDLVRDLQADLDAARDAQYKADYWREMYLELQRQGSGDVAATIDWSLAPELGPEDAQPLLDFLEKSTGGHLRFTDQVAKTWRKSRYAFPERMRESLIKLAKASIAFAESQGQIPVQLDDWFRETCDLDFALTDLTIKKSGKAKFDFEDSKNLNGVPHVKLGDGKTPRECGRIYFAYESSPARFIVHHVGIHNL